MNLFLVLSLLLLLLLLSLLFIAVFDAETAPDLQSVEPNVGQSTRGDYPGDYIAVSLSAVQRYLAYEFVESINSHR